eukprot:TRINITY_DN3316_c0_g1_i7.p1 TRINITY_DN3316_c0_g1~~TRINITY_DN3316_c0_g1_i7.p1  ORF type:complete len:156 (+),score=25.57 TRINITY_DN3316_c0_g1_i7:286-753(+)
MSLFPIEGQKFTSLSPAPSSFSRTRRFWKPNVHWKTFKSELLSQRFQGNLMSLRSFTTFSVPVTTKALRCVDKKGGIDNYVLYTPEKEMDSKIGLELKKLLVKRWEEVNGRKFDAKRELYDDTVTRWQKEVTIREQYREQLLSQISGREKVEVSE